MKVFFMTLSFTLSLVSIPASAFESHTIQPALEVPHVRFTNDNWDTLPHPEVAEFSIGDDGNAFGKTTTGIYFSQFTTPNAYGLRIQRFEIEDHYHYIVEGTVMNSLADLSVTLARAYEATQGSTV